MGLGGLDTALTGLHAAQQRLSVISGNISNASTPGYSRKILPQESLSVDGNVLGVLTNKVIRHVDATLNRDFWTQTSALSALDTQASYMTQIQQFHGDPSAGTNVAAAISKLADSFSALSDSPEDVSLQRSAVDAAQQVATKVKGFADLITQMRNDAQTDIGSSVGTINDLLQQIATLNRQVAQNNYRDLTTADIEDKRDAAIQQLSEQMQITTFTRSDGAIVVQTKQGTLLADENAQQLYFKPNSALSPNDAYPTGAASIYIGDPTKNANAVDLADPRNAPGGKLGALVDLRDDTLPRQQAEIDELAEKLASRFDQQGLRLFTDAFGNIPTDSAPVAGTTPVPYVGFASQFRVNPAVVAKNSLLQTGTAKTDVPVQQGSNEVIRRINDFAFGDVAYQTAAGSVDVRAAATGTTTLQNWFGLYSQNQIVSSKALSTYADTGTLIAAGDTSFGAPNPLQTSMTLTFAESRTGTGPVSVTVDLAQANIDFPIGGSITNAADQIAAEINQQIAAASVPASLAAAASVNSYGQLVLKSTGDITIDASGVGQMGTAGLSFIGLTAGTQKTTDPSFTVQVGADLPYTIALEPGDDETDLVNKLQYNSATGTGIPGLYVDIDASGHLTLRPGGDDSNNGGPLFGGDLTLTGNFITADGTGTSGTSAGTTILASIFGTASPVADVGYASTSPFRTTNLGKNATLNTGVLSATNILDYAQKMIDRQTEEITQIKAQNADATTYKSMIQKTINDQSGVNLDDELANMITTQTAYAAAARVVSAINDSFQTLLASFR